MTLYFGQQHPYNIDYFGGNWVRPTIEEFPHYKFLEGNEEEYSTYIDLSWRLYSYSDEHHEKTKSKFIDNYKTLVSNIIKQKVILTPIQVTTTLDGHHVIINGNHRASIAKYYDIDLPIKTTSYTDRLRQLSLNASIRYGSGDTDVPYQPILYRGEVLVEGRRSDALERFELINIEDIRGKAVIDFGSNLGTNTFWAHEQGAKIAVGLEKEQRLGISAIRISVILGYPVPTEVVDLSRPLRYSNHYDTGFCFSIDRHVNNNQVLADNISNSGISVLYFESHDLRGVPIEISDKFQDCKLIGKTFNNKRNFYKLVR